MPQGFFASLGRFAAEHCTALKIAAAPRYSICRKRGAPEQQDPAGKRGIFYDRADGSGNSRAAGQASGGIGTAGRAAPGSPQAGGGGSGICRRLGRSVRRAEPFGLGFVLGFAEDCFAPCAAGAALGMLLHGFGALSLRSVCMLCALGAAVAARWMGARKLAPAALAGCGTLVGMALCFAFGGEGTELMLYSAADALLAAATGSVCGSSRPKGRVPGCFW